MSQVTTNPSPIGLDQRLRRRSDLLATPLGHELVMLDIVDGAFFSFNKTATEIWALLERDVTVQEICDILMQRYNVAPDVCEAGVRQTLEYLYQQKLIDIHPGEVVESGQ